MRLMNFGFSVEKDGSLRALPNPAGDVLALLEAMGILGKKWGSFLGFISEDKLERIDFLYKIYYPIYLVREGKHVIPIDGMGLHKFRVKEFTEFDHKYVVQLSKTYDLPLIGNEKLLSWMNCAVEGRIEDGYAIPHVLTREEAIFAAKEAIRIYVNLKEYLGKLTSSLESSETRLREELEKIRDEYKRINEEYGRKIAEKNIQIEGLLSGSENEIIRKIKEEFQRRKELLRNERKSLEKLVKNLMGELRSIESRMEKIKSGIHQFREEIVRGEARRERLKLEKKMIDENIEKFDNVRNIIKELEECEKLIEENKRNEEKSLENLSELEKQRDRTLKRVEEVQKRISMLVEEEKVLPTREDLELREAREEFVMKRRAMVGELDAICTERDRALWNLRVRESRLKLEYKKFKDFTESTIKVLEEELGKIRSYIWKDMELNEDVELLYIPYYITYKNDRLTLIESPIVMDGFKKLEDFKDFGLSRDVVEEVFGSGDVLPVILFEAKEVFNILSKKNRSRVLEGISILKEVGAIGRMQEAILLKRCA
ncbi:MAG: hypothetical protein H5T34_05335 [Candidatus Methanomethyliales bacterium]|nr:hypothetical protein [Candidatus Methanomethylicales archaeon]